MKKFFLGCVFGALTATSAFAADIYAPAAGGYKDAPYIASPWAGWYTGFNAGYAFSNGDPINYYFNDPAAGTTSTTFRFDKSKAEGGFGGTYGGYNFQRGQIVFGIETDFQGGDITNKTSKLNPLDTLDTYAYKSDLAWWGTARGRLGYSFGPALVYATGGLAYGLIDSQVTYTSTYPQLCCGAGAGTVAFGRNNNTETKFGYVVGGGLEYAFSQKYTIKAEYQYLDLGNTNVGTNYCYLGCTTNELHAKVDHTYNVVNVGVAYHFGGDISPLK